MLKIQSFFIAKFSSARLRDSNYKIENITLDQLRQNGEIVRLSNSELLRAIRRIRCQEFNQQELDDLIRKKKKRKSSTVGDSIDKILYIDDIITVEFDDSRHYKSIIDRGGITINGKIYKRLLTGAGMARRSTVMFCNEEIIEDLLKFLNCGRSLEHKIVPSKFNAYLALASSSTWRVPTPKFVVIPDCEIERLVEVDFLHESENLRTKDPLVYPEKKLLKVNLFDGQGLISPKTALEWQEHLQIDYTPSSFVFRGAFLKGLLVTFDFHAIAKHYNITKIKDVYGKEYWIEDIDVILSSSQMKLWEAYNSSEDYYTKCQEYDFSWGVTRCSPKKDKNRAFSTYQYLQNLNLNTSKQIENLCEKTITWFKNVSGYDWVYTQLFLMGNIESDRILDSAWFDNIDNPLLQSLLLEPNLINDKQIQSKIQRLINKKIKESYLGMLLIEGNYQFMISDPVAQAEWGLGLQPQGLLKEKEHYSKYWNNKNIDKVSSIRSPMTWRSELVTLNLKNNKDTDYWYKYLNSGIVFNIYGNDMMRMSGADFDGDICMTTNQSEFIDCGYTEFFPPYYERKIAEKKIIIEEDLWKYDVKTFKSKIGLITNIGTQFFAMLKLFNPESEEYKEIINRLKICNCLQSMEIDRAKGIQTMDIPKYWTKWENITGDESPEELHIKELHHKTICDKRPYFFRYLYSSYDKCFQNHKLNYDNYCESKYDGNFYYILNKKEKTEEEIKTISCYYRYINLLDSDCPMNLITHYMENNISELKKNNKLKSFSFDNIIFNKDMFNYKNYIIIENIYQKYKQYKISINYHSNSSGFQDMMLWLRKQSEKINISSEEFIYWATKFGMSFVIDVFPDDLIDVLKKSSNNLVMVAVKTDDGYIDYMGSKYEIRKIEV